MVELKDYIHEICQDDIKKIVFSNQRQKEKEYKKIQIVEMEQFFQIQRYTQKQVFHENIKGGKLEEVIWEILKNDFRQLNAWGQQKEYSLKLSKKEKILFHKSPAKSKFADIQPHNRRKHYILEEGTVIEPLIDMGVFTKEGKVAVSMYDKYKQINRFIEIIDDAVSKSDLKELNIVDFGCGKSYLTFITYYYFAKIKKIKVRMTGLDLKEEVIQKCNETARKYGYDDLRFQVGDINGFLPESKVDMVISLHACDTATDYALFNGIMWKSKMIISVPCCQHEFYQQMDSENLKIVERYGIIKERVSASLTDAVRGNILTYFGYKTQLLEFIDFEHTPKNILIRGVKTNISKEQRAKALEEVNCLIKCFHFNPTLLRLLEEKNFLIENQSVL